MRRRLHCGTGRPSLWAGRRDRFLRSFRTALVFLLCSFSPLVFRVSTGLHVPLSLFLSYGGQVLLQAAAPPFHWHCIINIAGSLPSFGRPLFLVCILTCFFPAMSSGVRFLFLVWRRLQAMHVWLTSHLEWPGCALCADNDRIEQELGTCSSDPGWCQGLDWCVQFVIRHSVMIT